MLKSYLTRLCLFAAMAMLCSTAFGQSGNITVTAPAGIAGDYFTRHAAFGPLADGQSGQVVLADDGDVTGTGGTINDGCQTILNDVSGKIALINRGTCGFAVKATNAQAAGAIAVIVCNNLAAFPDSVTVMGNAATDPLVCNLTIPAVQLSVNSCNTIKAELANGVMATLPDFKPEDGEAIGSEIQLPGAGTYTADTITGVGYSIFSDATAIKVYSITASSDAVMRVHSCLGGSDTRLSIYQGCRNRLLAVGSNDDACEFAPGSDLYASDLKVLVSAGAEYLIVWDNAWSASGFDFEVSFESIPNVDVTFQVDMQNETVAADGVNISINGGTEQDMTDQGNGVWTYTTSILAGSPVAWLYSNGAGNFETDTTLVDCRIGSVPLEPAITQLVCYNSCFPCPPPACSNPNAVICDDFDDYNLGGLNGQAPHWGIWTGGTDGNVTAAQAFSGTQSAVVSNNGTTDLLLLLGNQTTGQWRLSWKMYVPTGKGAYYNLQESETPGVDWNLDAFFGVTTTGAAGPAGQGTVQLEGANAGTFTFPENTWFDVVHMIDLDRQQVRYFVNGKLVVTGAYQGQLGSVDFFSINTANVEFYIDDVLYIDVPEPSDCDASYIICDGLEFYDAGTFTGPQADYWTTWSGTEGGAEDGIVSDEVVYEGLTSMKVVGQNGPQDVLLKLGNKSAGRYYLSWRMYIPTGEYGYYNIQQSETPAVAWNLNTQFNAGGTGDADGSAFTFPHDTWFEVFHAFDLDNNVAYLIIDGAIVKAWEYTGNLGSVDYFATNEGPHLFYVDNVAYLQIPSSIGDYCYGSIDLNDYIGNGLGTVSTTPLYDNSNAGADTQNFDPATGWECYLEPDGSGSGPTLDNNLYYTFVGDGNLYFIETGDCGSANYIADGDTQISIYTGDCDNLTPVAGACVDDGPNAVPGNWIAGLEFQTEAGVTYTMSVDGFGGASGEFCINFTQNSGSAPTFDVTFEVDMTDYINAGGTISPEGMHVAGAFQGWDPAATAMTQIGTTKSYTVTLELEAGTYEYKFINGNAWGTCDIAQECLEAGLPCGSAGNDNRSVTVAGIMTAKNCYDKCGACLTSTGTDDVAFSEAITMQPNPADSYANVVYNFEQSNDLNIRLVNSLGQLVSVQTLDKAQNGSLRLDLSSLPAGAYNVVFSNGEQVATKRLIVE